MEVWKLEELYNEEAFTYRILVFWDVTLQAVSAYQPVTLIARKNLNLNLVSDSLISQYIVYQP